MSDLWIPEYTPPQVTAEAEDAVLGQVLEFGLDRATRSGTEIIESTHEPLAEYLDRFGFALNTLAAEGLWADKVLKTGAAISMLAYRETGYFHEIDDESFDAGAEAAKVLGIPEAYNISFILDANLITLIEAVQDTPKLAESASMPDMQGGYGQVLKLGAGCVRHFLQQSIAA
jgi:hypothetical protein